MSKNLNKIWLLLSIFTVAICAVLFATTFATAEEPSTNDDTLTISGKVVDSYGPPRALKGALASGSFFKESGEAYITQDVRTGEDGTFEISGVIKNSYGAITFYPADDDTSNAGKKYYIDNPVTESLNIGSITLPPLTQDVSGKISDMQGNGIAKAKLEFYSPTSVKSPFPDAVAITKSDGTFTWDDFIKDPEQYFNGIAIGQPCYVEVTTEDCDKTYSPITRFISVLRYNNVLNFKLDRIVNVKLYDYDQTENGWTEWYHEVYINGVMQGEGGYLGDSNLQIPMNSKLEFKDNCRLELSYSLTTNDNAVDYYVETFTPIFQIAEEWEPKEFDPSIKYKCWLMWLNSKAETDTGTSYFEGDSFAVDENTNRIFLDVGFNERPVTPANDVTQSAQTGDENGMLIAILAAVVALAIIGLASYFVINKVKNNKTKAKHPKH